MKHDGTKICTLHVSLLSIIIHVLIQCFHIHTIAQTEMEMYTTLFNKLTTTCFSKCVSRKHKQEDLALGETSCIDRCVAKYMASQQKIGTVLQKANEAQMEQAKRMQQMQQAFGG